MPDILGKLRADVLSVNPYAAAGQSPTFDRWEHALGVSALVKASGAHFGAVLDPDGERITLVDEDGRILSDSEGLLALLSLVLRSFSPGGAETPADPGPEDISLGHRRRALFNQVPVGASPRRPRQKERAVAQYRQPAPSPAENKLNIALPVSAPRRPRTCLQAGAEVIWTKLSASHLMEVASGPGVEFAAATRAGTFSRGSCPHTTRLPLWPTPLPCWP